MGAKFVTTQWLSNIATVLGRHFRQNRSNANQITDILAPRVVRFGVRCIF